MIKDIKHAEQIIKNNSADLVSFGRKFINSPNWLIKALLKTKQLKYPINIKDVFKKKLHNE